MYLRVVLHLPLTLEIVNANLQQLVVLVGGKAQYYYLSP